MSGPANKRVRAAGPEVVLDGCVVETPEAYHNSLVGLYAFLEGQALRRGAILTSLMVDGVPIRMEKPIVPLRLFRRVEAITTRFDDFAAHLVPSLQRKVRLLMNRVEVAAELAIINDWPVVQRLWWDLQPDLKEPLLILNILARQPAIAGAGIEFSHILRRAEDGLNEALGQVDDVFLIEDPIAMSDVLEQKVFPWLDEIDAALGGGR